MNDNITLFLFFTNVIPESQIKIAYFKNRDEAIEHFNVIKMKHINYVTRNYAKGLITKVNCIEINDTNYWVEYQSADAMHYVCHIKIVDMEDKNMIDLTEFCQK